MTHSEECWVLNGLIIDLRKKMLDREHEPITEDRLNEASKAIAKIQQCRKQAIFRDLR